jgi:pyridoxamine 5'-phosphate oxidase
MSVIADLRKEYQLKSLSEADVAPGAIEQFKSWWDEAVQAQIDEVNAMTLATATLDGVPSARVVLLKGFSEEGFRFFTNYHSAKGKQLNENPRACLVFFWKELERQVRVTGTVAKLAAELSDEYFYSRPVGSRIGAWTSPQSQVIESREWLQNEELNFKKEFNEKNILRPPHWGGYLVKPLVIEFWQGRASRLHDRLQYTMLENGEWKVERLAP